MRRRRGVRMGVAVVASLVVGAPVLLRPVPIAAQAGLEEVERLTRMGRTEEARAALATWWEGDRSEADRRELQRGLWLRGRLTVDPVQAELDFQRLAVLYPSGQFTPDAVLRLAQASWAMGDEASARRYVATLERDYPRSEATERGVEWLADPGPLPPPGDQAAAADVGGGGRDAPGASEADRPDADDRPAAADRPDPGADDDPPAAGRDPSAPPMNYSVQLGAFADRERALALHGSVRDRGVDARVIRVQGSRFTHVRVGRFAERAAAVELLEELAAQGISAALVRDDRRELPLGDGGI